MHDNRNKDECPKCGCKKISATGNMEDYPDHYEAFNCKHCGFLVGMIDNSPYVSCYEFEDFAIEI
jgi:predicted RNA-binding Zn-ribbon protein involved in translation (DUF1610 family)